MADQQAYRRGDESWSAAVALAGADQAQADVRWHSRWVVRYLYGWTMGTLVFLPLTGLEHRESVLVSWLWTAFVLGSFVYVRRQRVVPAGSTRLYLLSLVTWSLLWTGALVVGLTVFPGVAGFWIPAGALVSLPPFVAARAVRR